MNNELVTEFPFSDSIMVSGQILTNIPHVAIYANGTRCLVDSLIPNPDFKIVIPYNAILDSVKIEVVDHLGFPLQFLFKINHKEALRVAANQMGKTWFDFIENSEI
ncbi:MAG: hypothetical protein IPK08_19970 [Bacteroidetes bacterium]|nr:hypothetical protein [Bacteroidota bacterium]